MWTNTAELLLKCFTTSVTDDKAFSRQKKLKLWLNQKQYMLILLVYFQLADASLFFIPCENSGLTHSWVIPCGRTELFLVPDLAWERGSAIKLWKKDILLQQEVMSFGHVPICPNLENNFPGLGLENGEDRGREEKRTKTESVCGPPKQYQRRKMSWTARGHRIWPEAVCFFPCLIHIWINKFQSSKNKTKKSSEALLLVSFF